MRVSADPGWTPPAQPVGPATGLRYGGFWIRTLAYLIDVLLLAIVMAVLAKLAGIGFYDVTVRDVTVSAFSSR